VEWFGYMGFEKGTVMDQKKWDKRYLDLAQLVSTWSKDVSTKVGSVIVSPGNRVISLGYNGLPAYVPDDPEILHNRERKLAHTIHSEMNSILSAQGTDLTGSTLYVYPFAPCSNCASAIIQVGIMRVVSYQNDNPRWVDSIKAAQEFFRLADVEYTLYPGV